MATRLIIIITTTMAVVAALPVKPPDLTRCQPALEDDKKTNVPCCIPVGDNNIIDFVPPPPSSHVRIRPAAHLVDAAYVAKYNKAVAAMKALDANHPWNHLQQANVHCAYCNGAYNMTGYPNITLQIHASWLFFPFHRLYIYFYERILGRLIGDDTFALPFWNYDSPDGMMMPAMYVNQSSSLYDPLRNHAHQPPTVTNLNIFTHTPTKNMTESNLQTMYRQMVRASTAELFFGSRYVAGSQPAPGYGSIELTPHNSVHLWTGDNNQPNVENMGAFYAAARDPIFFAHHANIDRIWNVWSALPGPNRKGFNDNDWLDASFVFWDENMQLVRAKVRDCLDTLKLGYTYQNMSIPWIDHKPVQSAKTDILTSTEPTERLVTVSLPVRLTSAVSVEVKRPKLATSEHEEEVLVVDGIEFVNVEAVNFDVLVNMRHGDESIGPESANFAGSFVHLPMGVGGKPRTMKTKLSLGVSELLREMKADGDESIVVSFIPRSGKNVTVGNVRIEFMLKCFDNFTKEENDNQEGDEEQEGHKESE